MKEMMSKFKDGDLDARQRGYIEGYAAALDRIMYATTHDSPSSKSYDPMTIDGNTMHSYAFNMKDGGRHHPISEYESVDEICAFMFNEALDWMAEGGVRLCVEIDRKFIKD